MKKYIYKPQKFTDCKLVKWTKESGLEELDSFVNEYLLTEIYFDTLDELREQLVKEFYSIDFVTDYDDVIFVRWYETSDCYPVEIDESDSDWKDFCDGKIALYEHSLCIELSDIYINQTIESFNEIQP